MLSKFSHLLLKPLYGELPFFILFFFFISQTAFKTLVANWRDLSYGFATITYLCLSVLICYVLTSFIHYTKSKLVKWGFYCLGIILFAVYVFLWLVFGTSLSPVIIVILGETNFNESSEFLNAFLFSPRGIISMACILIMIGIVILFEKHKTFIQQKVRLLAYTKKH